MQSIDDAEERRVDRFDETDQRAAQSTNLGSVIPGRHRLVASPESITTSLGVWIPGSRKSAPRNDAAYDSNFNNAFYVVCFVPFNAGGERPNVIPARNSSTGCPFTTAWRRPTSKLRLSFTCQIAPTRPDTVRDCPISSS